MIMQCTDVAGPTLVAIHSFKDYSLDDCSPMTVTFKKFLLVKISHITCFGQICLFYNSTRE